MTTDTPAPPVDDAPLDALIAADLAQLLRAHDLMLTLGNVTLVLIVTAMFHRTAPAAGVAAWLAVQAAVLVWNLVLGVRQRSRGWVASDAPRVMRRATRASVISGLMWLVGIQVFWPGNSESERMLLMCWMIDAATLALQALHAHLPAFFALAGSCVAGIVIAVSTNAGESRVAILGSVALFAFLSARFAVSLNRLLLQSLRQRHEVAVLAGRLRVEKDRAVSLGQSRSRFLAAASHDLRQPAHALSLFVEVLNKEPMQPPARRIVQHVRNAVDAMSGMFDALLDISKLDADMLQPELRGIALRPLIDRIAADEAQRAEAKGLVLHCRMPASVHVFTDPILLERILRNLLSNAIRYTTQGSVTLRARVVGERVRITVADTGCGIPKARQQEAFEEFVQLHNPERDREKGLGLGLAIVRRLVDLLKLRLALRSAPARGTVFALHLPLAAEDAATTPAPASPAPPRERGLARGDVVIVIDDDLEIQAAMRELIASWGCVVFCAKDVEELMPRLMTLDRQPRVLVCDYRLRDGQTGLDMVAQLHAAFNDEIPAVVVTGDTGAERLREAAAGGWPVLHKPVTEGQLREAMEQALIG